MDDKNLMENMLLLEKGVCDLFMHATIESPTPDVHKVFASSLNSVLAVQDDIFDKMSAKGWYQTDQAEQTKITSLKQKFSQQ